MGLRVAAAAFVLCWSFWSSEPKVYERCELAHEFRDVYNLPETELGTWLCIAYYESLFNTSALNSGSGDHGLFQISELFWCSSERIVPCDLDCSLLEDDDIADDVKCALKVYQHHKEASGDGFAGWVVYNSHCKNPGRVAAFLDGCFGAPSSPTLLVTSPESSSVSPTAFRFPPKARKLVSYKPSSPYTKRVKPTSPKPPVKALFYKPLRANTSPGRGKPLLKPFIKYKPRALVTKIPKIITTRKSPINFRPFALLPSSRSPVTDSPFTSTAFSKVTPSAYYSSSSFVSSQFSKATPSTYSARSLDLRTNDNIYAIVNNSGHSFAIGANGFKLVWTGL